MTLGPRPDQLPPLQSTAPVVVTQAPQAHTWVQSLALIAIALFQAWTHLGPTATTGPTPAATAQQDATTTALLDLIKHLSQSTPAVATAPTTTSPDATKQLAADMATASAAAQTAVAAAVAKGQTSREVLAPLAATTFRVALHVAP